MITCVNYKCKVQFTNVTFHVKHTRPPAAAAIDAGENIPLQDNSTTDRGRAAAAVVRGRRL